MIRLIIFLCFLLYSFPVMAGNPDMDHFKQIPILDEGRLKPLDSFARISLKKLSGKESIDNLTGIEFLAETVFDPGNAIERRVFKIENPNIRHRFGLNEEKGLLYSYTDIVPGLKKTSSSVGPLMKQDRQKLNKDDKDLLDIHDKALGYTSLLRSLSLVLPLDVSLPRRYADTKKDNFSYLDLRKLEQDLGRDVQKIVATKGEDFNRYSEDEKRAVLLSFQLQLMSSAAADNESLKIIPPQWQDDQGNWHAPWELIRKGEGSPATAELMKVWRDMGHAYLLKDNNAWIETSSRAAVLATTGKNAWKLKAEILKNTYPPAEISTAFYILTFAACLGFMALNQSPVYRASIFLLGAGASVHATGMVIRALLLDRPPVGTLYETMIFVSLIAVLISFFIERSSKNGSGILIGSLTGLLIGLLSFAFTGDGDTMGMLTAVLNTNFWLATHVLCITMGYGWCILTALLAHFSLITQDNKSDTALHTLTIFALLFTSVGTILGGIWADQSWGRFWGWDPKENGALLIVLWLTWLLHGKLGHQLNRVQFLAGLAFLNVIVAISWVGVNLLGVGLHSYGFADGYFYGLGIFIAVEAVLIGYLWKHHA